MNQGSGGEDNVDVSGRDLVIGAAQSEAGKITRCILHIFFFRLTIKNGILYKWVFSTVCESACDNSVELFL